MLAQGSIEGRIQLAYNKEAFRSVQNRQLDMILGAAGLRTIKDDRMGNYRVRKFRGDGIDAVIETLTQNMQRNGFALYNQITDSRFNTMYWQSNRTGELVIMAIDGQGKEIGVGYRFVFG